MSKTLVIVFMEKYKNMFGEPRLALGALAVVVVAGVALYMGVMDVSAQERVGQARAYIVGESVEYDITKARSLYEMVLEDDPTHQEALFSLARIYYITGEYDSALTAINTHKELYPDNKRIHYIAGLANAFAGNLYEAEMEMREFVNSSTVGWQGYLDLGWIYFQQGAFERAKAVLEEGIDIFGHNAWLNTSLGATLVALGEYERAEEVLTVAKVQANNISEADWHHNYSFGDRKDYEQDLASMQSAIELNLSLARGEMDMAHAAQALRAGFVSAAPQGYNRGLAVSACGASNSCETISCTSAPNACGQVSAGTRQECTIFGSTSCNASTPSLPNGYGQACTVTNSCGNTSSGTIGCNGTCNATPPGQCDPFAPVVSSGTCTVGELFVISITATDPEGDNIRYGVDWDNDGSVDQFVPSGGFVSSGTTQSAGNVFATDGVKTIRVRTEDENGAISPFVSHEFICTESVGDASIILGGGAGSSGPGGPNPSGGLIAEPLLVQEGQTTAVIWGTNNTESCTVTGTNGDSWSGTSGTQTSSALSAQTIFELNCDGGAVVDSVTVNIVPEFQEF